MNARVGDRIVLAGDTPRAGVVTAVGNDEGDPPYRVRWDDDGRVTLIFPGTRARIIAGTRA